MIFVNGCFWHGHDCSLFRWPKSNAEFWQGKIEKNIERDRRNLTLLDEQGWRTLVVWECAMRGRFQIGFDAVCDHVAHWLQRGSSSELTENKMLHDFSAH